MGSYTFINKTLFKNNDKHRENMKKYLSFNLNAQKLLPVWIMYLVLVLSPYILLTKQQKGSPADLVSAIMVFATYIIIAVVAYLIVFYIAKLVIDSVSYKDQALQFGGSFGEYVGKVLLGFFLSIITLGIYFPWFIQSVMSFFIDNTTYSSSAFKFKGKGLRLFLIITLVYVLPLLILIGVMARVMITDGQTSSMILVIQFVMFVILIPYIYLVYKWMVDIAYKGFNIAWKTKFWNACGKIALELLLVVITVGIYWPLAMLKLYQYFAERTFAQSDLQTLRFGYDLEQLRDFLFLWGQSLLTIITLGIYYPWALSKIGARVLGKTYLVEK